MLELCDDLAALTSRIVIVGLVLLVGIMITVRYLWRHHRDRLVREDLDGPPGPPAVPGH
jgi:hypothetical protein